MTDAFKDFPLTERYSALPFPGRADRYGVWDRDAVDWTRDAAGWEFTYTERDAVTVAHNLNAPQYVCACGYTVRRDDRDFHNASFCPLTAPQEICPQCESRTYCDGSCRCTEALAPNAGSAC